MMPEELIYLYCVSREEPNFNGLDLGNRLYSICHRDLYAIASKVSEDEFSEANLKKNLANLEWIKEKATRHEKIIEGVMESACVIPFKFGTIFNTEGNLKAMLDEQAQNFKANLKNLAGKEEWGIKIYCDIEKLKERLHQEDKEFSKVDREITSSSCGKAFFLNKKKEELLNRMVDKKMNEYGQDSFERIRKQSLQARINKLLPKEVTERKDDMILNAAFLVDKNKVNAFVSIVDILKRLYEENGLSFDCTGPWPPYNFCETQTYGTK